MAIDWNEVEKENKHARMAEPGVYEVEVNDLNIRESKNSKGETSYWMELQFDEVDGVRFPKLSRSISRNKINWTAWHFMNILKEFGISEEKAKQAIENCENKKSEKDIIATYLSTFDRAIAKNPKVKIEVFEDPNGNINPNTGRPYKRADFANKQIAFSRDAQKGEAKAETIADQGEDVDLSEIPF